MVEYFTLKIKPQQTITFEKDGHFIGSIANLSEEDTELEVTSYTHGYSLVNNLRQTGKVLIQLFFDSYEISNIKK